MDGASSVVGELPLSRRLVVAGTRSRDLKAIFDTEQSLCGVVVNDGNHCVGAVSRAGWLHILSSPYGRDLYLGRPVGDLVSALPQTTQLPHTCRLDVAVKIALARDPAIRYEPLLVRGPGGDGLLDVNELLLAQSTLLEQTMGHHERERDAARRAADRLEHQAHHDALTGLPNRVLYRLHIERCVQRAQFEPSFRFAALFIDLDRFKNVNDSLGHAVGDQLLVNVAGVLQRCAADMPIAEMTGRRHGGPSVSSLAVPPVTLARMGGDEFTLLLAGIPGVGPAVALADRILTELSKPALVDGHEIVTTASIGIALGGPTYDSADDLLRDADAAMYRAKATGKACHVVFDATLHDAACTRLRLENDLRRALDRGELGVAYQPIVSLKTGAPTGFEALLRWHHADEGIISPTVFIPIAEDAGLIGPISEWVIDQAFRQLRVWQDEFGTVDHGQSDDEGFVAPLTMSVNVSRKQLVAGEALVAAVAGAIERAGVAASCVRLEITESAVMADGEAARRTLEELRSLGVRLEMDDFGVGHSSLSCLHRLPLDGLKVDREFIRNMSGRRDYAAVIQAIISLARNLDMTVVAEGVENADEVAMLQALECDQAQGFYFAQPMSITDATAYLDRARNRPAVRVA
jgi:predicted signal transduction protein with EAL and GGDEF domain